jgi:GT2 family glycosyltransferase
MDNDTLGHKDFLKNLVEAMEADKELAIVSSVRFTKYQGKPTTELCGEDLIRGHQSLTFDTPEELAKLGTMTCVWVPGCSMLLRSSIIREIGLFDKRMITHCSDNDICFRAINAGYKIAYIPSSQITHIRNVTVTHMGIVPYVDQRVLIGKLSGLEYLKILNTLPLDAESHMWGKVNFITYKK